MLTIKKHIKKLTFVIGMFSFTNSINAQNQNALVFDNLDDKVLTNNASALIANSTQISMSLWVYPQNNTMTGLDYDGFCGFRDNAFADFYIVQLTAAGKIECRFRNSSGTTYDINYTNINLNNWNHLTLTYDGSYMRFYHNAILKDSIAATGTITSLTNAFYMGMLLWPGSDFYLKGKLDEVSLWNKSLSQSEINCIYLNGIDSTSANLQLYYKFNQGIAGGNNAGLTSLTDASGNINGTLTGFALTGTISNYVAGKLNYVNIVDSICNGDTYVFNGQTLTTSGIYTQTYTSINGCDSSVQLTLTVTTVDTSVAQSGVVLAANENGATYKWVDCNNNFALVPGATLKTFSPSQPGSYAVIVTKNGCIDTSGCHTVTSTGLFENQNKSVFKIYPTITDGQLFIEGNAEMNVNITVSDLSGRIVFNKNTDLQAKSAVDVSTLAKGSYLLHIIHSNGEQTTRFTKE